MTDKPKIFNFGSSIVKIREPLITENARVVFLLHGWTGNESSMWVFGDKLDKNWLVIAPRAPYQIVDPNFGGYSWVNQSLRQWPNYEDFFSAVGYMQNLIENISNQFVSIDFSRISLIGFSQGAAMAFVFAGVKNSYIEKLALLSGFLPPENEGFVNPKQFVTTEVLIGHGTRDDIVPINKALEARRFFENSSRSLVYCVSDVGHRLGSDCFKALQSFMNN